MTKEQYKQVSKLMDSMTSLLETGYFPGRKAVKVLDALRYIQLMKEELNVALKAPKAQEEGSSEEKASEEVQAVEGSEKL